MRLTTDRLKIEELKTPESVFRVVTTSRETIRVELTHVVSHLRIVREEHGGVFEDSDTLGPLHKIRSTVDSLSGEDTLKKRAEDIEASFDRIIGELDAASYPQISEQVIELQSECRQGNYKRCIQLADSIVEECEDTMDVDPLYEGSDPFDL